MTEVRSPHVWVIDGERKSPGLIIAWRREESGWCAFVAIANAGSVLASWRPAANLRPIADSRPAS